MAKLSVRNLLIIAGIVGLLLAVLVGSFLSKHSSKQAVSTTGGLMVVVAKVDIPPRTIITSAMVEERSIPAAGLQPDVATSLEKVVGSVTLDMIFAEEQIINKRILGEVKSAGFTGQIPEGYRAMTIMAIEPAGVAGFPKPGDFVDVIGIWDKKDVGIHAADMVLQNLRILAINRNVETRSTTDNSKDKAREKEALVTLAVTSQEAVELGLLEEKGKIRLALRPFLPEGDVTTRTTVPDDQIGLGGRVAKSAPSSAPKAPSSDYQAPPVMNSQPPMASGGVVVIRGTKMFVSPIN